MKVLVIGSGGREHALAWKIKQSPRVSAIFCAPGNAGTESIGKNLSIPIKDQQALLKFALEEKIDLTVVGPDDALAAGIVDLFEKNNLRIFGPSQKAAQFESSKIFAKEFMQRHNIPTARFGQFSESTEAHKFCQTMNYPLVIKADGLALGKGVIIAQNPQEAASAIYRIMELEQFGAAGKRVVIEEFLQGEECSIHALVDGKDFLLFPSSQDHKQIFDNDQGPNTGGMGTYSPAPLLSEELRKKVEEEVLQPFVKGLQAEGLLYKGMLYPGLMIVKGKLYVLEFNARFGDPETQVLLTRLKSDLVDLLEATIDGTLAKQNPEWDSRASVCVVLASGGYPGSYENGKEITGIDSIANSEDTAVFHAGTKRTGGRLVTNGGRVMGITALGENLKSAREKAYEGLQNIQFEGRHYRTDIASKGL